LKGTVTVAIFRWAAPAQVGRARGARGPLTHFSLLTSASARPPQATYSVHAATVAVDVATSVAAAAGAAAALMIIMIAGLLHPPHFS
jgi:hypothetical protein